MKVFPNQNELDKNWDLVVVGGGITGAGIFREAVRMGLKVLLVEQKDFSWGTSSRSSKMVHGGLRYLKDGHFMLTRTSVHERERLLKESPGLIEPLEIQVPIYSDHGPAKQALNIGLAIYGRMGHEQHHHYYKAEAFYEMVPGILEKNLVGGFSFFDAPVDDARLVMHLINEAVFAGGTALNYTTVKEIIRDPSQRDDPAVQAAAARLADDAEHGIARMAELAHEPLSSVDEP